MCKTTSVVISVSIYIICAQCICSNGCDNYFPLTCSIIAWPLYLHSRRSNVLSFNERDLTWSLSLHVLIWSTRSVSLLPTAGYLQEPWVLYWWSEPVWRKSGNPGRLLAGCCHRLTHSRWPFTEAGNSEKIFSIRACLHEVVFLVVYVCAIDFLSAFNTE